MANAATKAPSGTKQPPSTAARMFWRFAQQFAAAANEVARTPRAELVEGGIRARSQETSPHELAAELSQLTEKLDEIRERLAKDSAGRSFAAERERATSAMAKMIEAGALIDSTTFVERLNFSRQALSKALKAHRVFFVEVAGQRLYPDFFLDVRLQRRDVELVSKALGELPGASKLQFFLTKKASLNGQTPLEALARGQFSRVHVAAQGFAER
jgi:hypothetical protein